jgi:type II secretory pathway pseudopilin PulG
MGQQQLLLIILGVIVVGIAVAVGITMFSDSAVNANRDALTNDLVNLASRAQQYFRRPTSLGGGGSTFNGLTADAAGIAKLTNKPLNGNGSYTITTAGTTTTGTAAFIAIEGYGNETGTDGTTPVKVHIKVFPSTDSVWVLN